VGRVLAPIAIVVALVVGLVLLAAVAAGSGPDGSGDSSAPAGPLATAGRPGSGGSEPGPSIPATWLPLYQAAAGTCPGLSWSVLAAVGTVESDNGRSTAPGVGSGSNPAGAEGPMQFEPATFAAYAVVGPGGARPASAYDPVDAVYTAAAMLCADGAGVGATLRAAVEDYNHSAVYADTVLTLSLAFLDDPSVPGTVVAALAFAARQLGTPYLWGGTGAGGFDCSGLTQAAYRSAGIALPRVAQGQFDAGPGVPAASAVEPGDLVFFGSGPSQVDHVGLYVGAAEMIDAPHTGAPVRLDDAHWPGLVGATRPG
jgi:cell wall-associated NlpC family hydrolase